MRRRSASVLVAAILLAGTSTAATAAPSATGISPVDSDHSLEFEDHRPRAEASIAVNPRNPQQVVISAMQFNQSLAAGLYSGYLPVATVWVSRTGGASYRNAGPLPLPRPKAQISEHAALAWDPHGPLYAVYSALPRYKQTADGAGLQVARSYDGGRTWQRTAVIEGVHCGGPHLPRVAVDPVRGWVYVAWTHEVEPKCDGTSDRTQMSVRWARSVDGGRTFTAPVDVTVGGVGEDPGLAVQPDGTLLVSYLVVGGVSLGNRVCPSVDQQVLVQRFSSTGARLGTSVAISRLCLVGGGLSANGATFVPSTYPAISSDPTNGSVVVAATYQGQVDRGVMTAASSDGGRTWRTTLVTGGPGTEATLPALSSWGGTTGLSWLAVEPGGVYTPTLTASSDGGHTWVPAVALATTPSAGNSHPQNGYDAYGFGAYQGLAVGTDGIAHAAWPDLRPRGENTQDVDVWTREMRLR